MTDPLLLSAAQTAQALGVSVRTVRAWDSGGRIPSPRRIGRATRWDAAELRDWIAAGCPEWRKWIALRSA